MWSTERGGRRRLGPKSVWLACLFTLVGTFVFVGQQGSAQPAGGEPAGSASAAPAEPQGPAINPATGELPDVSEIFLTSPVINGLLVLLSVVALLLFLLFITTINTGNMAPATFIDDVTKLVLSQQYREAADLCRSRHGVFMASIIQRCVENADKEHSVILEIVDTEGRRRADILWNRLSYLADISNVAPMLGLFGTVYGMMKAFYSAQFQSLSASSGALTNGIAQAMSTTMFGLAVAILAVAFYSIVKARATKALAEVEHAVHTIADHLKRNAA